MSCPPVGEMWQTIPSFFHYFPMYHVRHYFFVSLLIIVVSQIRDHMLIAGDPPDLRGQANKIICNHIETEYDCYRRTKGNDRQTEEQQKNTLQACSSEPHSRLWDE